MSRGIGREQSSILAAIAAAGGRARLDALPGEINRRRAVLALRRRGLVSIRTVAGAEWVSECATSDVVTALPLSEVSAPSARNGLPLCGAGVNGSRMMNLGIRLPDDLIAQADRVTAEISARGVKVSRNAVLRAALAAGLPTLAPSAGSAPAAPRAELSATEAH